jgi:hypothetical protein
MEISPMQARYLRFADLLRTGEFREPGDGWNASQVGAHIALSNQLFSELADRLHDGEDVSFDNSAVADDARLLAYAAGLGGLADVADAVQDSAARLEQAHDQLTPEERSRPIPVALWHAGHIVTDTPASLGDLITGNGEGHLTMHCEQLRALQATPPDIQASPEPVSADVIVLACASTARVLEQVRAAPILTGRPPAHRGTSGTWLITSWTVPRSSQSWRKPARSRAAGRNPTTRRAISVPPSGRRPPTRPLPSEHPAR